MRSMSVIGAFGIVAMVLLLVGWGLWSVFGGQRPSGQPQAQAASSIGAIGASAEPQGTDPAVNATSSATDPTGLMDPTATATSTAVPTSTAALTSPLGGGPSSTTTGTRTSTTSSTTTPGPAPTTTTPAPQPWGVTNVQFTCTLTGRRVQAVLTFTSIENVTAILRAGESTTTKTGSGGVSVTVSGLPTPADCWAAVDGRTVGTIPAT